MDRPKKISCPEVNIAFLLDKTKTIDGPFNANVTDIFRNQYLSPRPQSTSLEIPVQGIGEWCHPKFTVEINDSVFRSLAVGNEIRLGDENYSIPFSTPQTGKNIAFASLWDNYPNSVTIPANNAKIPPELLP